MAEKVQSTSVSDSQWLPDLCNPLALLRLMLLAVFIALVLTLLRHGVEGFHLDTLGVLFLYAVWVVFISAAGLCLLRRFTAQMPASLSSTLAVFWLLAAASICAAAAGALAQSLFLGSQLSFGRLWLETALTTVILGALVLRFLYVHHQLQVQQRRLMQAQFDALQARIRPHFLFNSLNSIAALVTMDSARAEGAILNLSDILRATLGEHTSVSLRQELEICRKYLDIEALRMGDRLSLRMELDDSVLEIQLPPLCLQPLIENAIVHGLQQRPEGGELLVQVQPVPGGGGVRICIENPLPGSSAESSGSRSALNNIRARLEQFYEGRVEFRVGRKGDRYSVEIIIGGLDV